MKNHDGWFRTVGVICVAAMAMSLVMFVIPGNVGMGAESPPTSFEISLDFPELEITDNGDGTDTLHLEGYPCSMDVGLPAIPSKTLSISVPPGMRADSLEVTRSDWKALPGAHAIRWGQPPAPSTEDFNPLPAPAPADQEVYGSDSPYPDQPVSLDGTGMMRKYSMARVKVTPVRYRPHSGTLEASGSMSIRVDCVPGRELEPKELADDSLEGVQSSIIDNFDQASSWYRPEGARSPLPQADTADYVIITTDALSTAADPLKNYKISQGLSVVTVTTSWLNTTYPLEPDLPARIRKYLKDNYVAYGIDYVLIVGNDSLVNMRRCYTPVEQGAAYDYTPTDYYYSDLSGDWDISRDGKYGQYGVDDIAGGVDFYPEVYVGRIPNDNAVEITSICNKIVNFQTDSGAWKKKALLLGATSNYANEDYSGYGATWGSTLMEEMKSGLLDPGGYTYTTMYEKAGRTPEPPACDMNLTNANVVSEWPKDYGLVNWWAHGSETAAWRKYWSTDDGDGVPESGEMSWPSLVTSADAASMDDAHPSVVFSCSCNTAWPENANSMDKAFMKQGASAFVGASRISWYRVGWANKDGGGNASIDYFFYKSLLEGNSAGKALRDSDLQYRNNYWFGGWDDCHHANLCGFNLYGDPSMTLNQPTNHTVTASVSGGHGTVSPPSQSVSYGGTATININPDTGYHIAGITDNGSPATIANPYVIKNVTANHTVVVTFAPAGLCTVTASVSGGHGTVSPPSQSVSYGGTATININPDTGYHIA
ncbi:MAG: hypothetical protein KKF66_05060, partial [Actinobacteria bacterium]|nr:hypothetical protein [Actinomycetota bacterium]